MNHHPTSQPIGLVDSGGAERARRNASEPGVNGEGRGPTGPISTTAPMADPDRPTHYRVSGRRVSIITDPYEVAIATIGAIRALTASAIRSASSDTDAGRSEP